MSAIYGLFRLDGAPDVRRDLTGVQAALAPFGPDGGGMWTQASVGLGRQLMCFTPEDRFERQPLPSAEGRHVLVSDGCLDNRPALARTLGLSTTEANVLPDGQLLLRAYARWGEDCVLHLVGAYAFALWDANARRLLLARSPVGGPPLFYHATPRTFAFATMPRGLFALPFVRRELDEQFVADALARAPAEPGACLYRGLLRLLPGHVLTASHAGATVRSFWDVDAIRDVRFSRDDDYVEAFRDLFDRVVGDHRRSRTPVGVLMSGGLDSASVAATAALQLACRGARLTAFTEVPRPGLDDPGLGNRYADETPFVQAIAHRHRNIELRLIRTDGRFFLEDLDRFFDAAESPFYGTSNRVWYETILQEAQQRHLGIVLTGSYGNATISWTGAGLLAQLLRAGRWAAAQREARALARQGSGRSTWRALATYGLLPLLPAPLWRAGERLRRSAQSAAETRWEDLTALRRDFAVEQRVEARAREKGRDLGLRPRLESRIVRAQTMRGATACAEMANKGYETLYGVRLRDPAADVRLVAFCLGLPETQYLRDGCSRWLIRRAMKDRLPPEVVNNTRRGMQAASWLEQLGGARASIFDELALLSRHERASRILDLPRLRGLVERLPAENDAPAPAAFLNQRHALEFGLMMGRFLRWFDQKG